MSLVWFTLTSAGGGPCWAALPLRSGRYSMSSGGERPVARDDGTLGSPRVASLVRFGPTEPPARWAIAAAPGAGVRLNGAPLRWGLAALNDRDEILLPGGERVFFSSECLAEVVRFPGAENSVFCARCKTEIHRGDFAVCCPGCATWCHQTETLPCWRYAGTSHCPLCDQPNDPEAGYRWIPEGL